MVARLPAFACSQSASSRGTSEPVRRTQRHQLPQLCLRMNTPPWSCIVDGNAGNSEFDNEIVDSLSAAKAARRAISSLSGDGSGFGLGGDNMSNH